jgi:hypothetical protein
MHKEILGACSKQQVDHINGNKLDNIKENLRLCTHAQNQHNRNLFRNNSTGYIGVTRKGDKYLAVIYRLVGGKSKPLCLGYYSTDIAAAISYNIAAEESRGEFAVLNVIPGHPVYSKSKNVSYPDSIILTKEDTKTKASYKRPKNRKVTNKSGYLGVSWSSGMKQWRADIRDIPNKKSILIGYFLNKNQAAHAYNEYAKKLYGDDAMLNSILESKEHIAIGTTKRKPKTIDK